ncbi:UDP-glycosyltransferase UGT5-like [Musca vetustissima]|uniref:UDP-glycosyltransferase UGT5-like n=1 Tax=Musca vetustissima TaxID=27455 RepID=UPI002AB5EF16|nr:UDP-glycosyltransferase UGT5-like [Musca vetustissima]
MASTNLINSNHVHFNSSTQLPRHFTCLTACSLVFVLLLLSGCGGRTNGVEGARILAAYVFPGKSHYGMHSALIKELVDRGHEVTMIAAFTLEHMKLGKNYTEILIEPVYDFWSDVMDFFKTENIFALTDMSNLQYYKMMDIIAFSTTEHALKQPKVLELINDPQPRGKFDLLLCEQFYQEPFLALSRVYDVPIVTSSTLGFESRMSQMMGVIMPWSFVPHTFSPYNDRMTFFERLMNSFYSLTEDIIREYDYFPKMDKLVEKYFGHLNVDIPPVSKLEQNISVAMVNSYTPLSTTRPLVPGMIAVGGLHIHPNKKLPEDLQTFLDGAVDGAIFFSLGSNVQSKDMPYEKMRIFLDVFASMKQRVIWKFENDSIPDMPKNILIRKWLPQSDILAHPNVKVFITHGGLFGTQEGVYHGVPMLGIPIYCDQHLNIRKAEQSGYAIKLHFPTITKELLKESLEKLIYNPQYRNNIQRYSTIFRDRPMAARETAVYWIEYVIRHKVATHLRSAGLDLKWYEFYLLDVIAFAVGVPLLIIGLLVFIVRKVCCRSSKSVKKLKRN